MNQTQPLSWSQMPRTEWERGGQVGKVMFVQPSLGPPSPSSVQGSVDFGQVLKGKKVTLPVEWGRAGPEDAPNPSPFSSKTDPLCSPLSFNYSPNKPVESAYYVLPPR